MLFDGGHSAEGESHYDNLITNGMRVMHFMDHHPAEIFHQYPNIYLPDGLNQHSTNYYPSVHPPSSNDSYNMHQMSSGYSFSPLVITPQPTYQNSHVISSPTSGVGFQPYHPSSQTSDNLELKRIHPVTEIKAVKR